MIPHALAWIPVLDPLPLGEWWWLTALPLCWLIAFAYKAIRAAASRGIVRGATVMAVQLFVVLLSLWLATEILMWIA